MEAVARIESCLEEAIAHTAKDGCPPMLSNAVNYAVFPGGARVRPQLCVSVASACSGKESPVVDHAAAALEMLHCASLVHDDLPCFDDAGFRRGRVSVHKLYGEELAVLVGDALIVEAFKTIARGCESNPAPLPELIKIIAESVGMPRGIVAGQAWESEAKDSINIEEYHRAKTGSLFVGAVTAGAIAVGEDPEPWRPLGEYIGQAYQMADDLMDAVGSTDEVGKPISQDTANLRPNAVVKYGVKGVMKKLRLTVEAAANSIPECEGAEELHSLIISQATRLVPSKLQKSLA
jgi:geranylgeranyl diphosphate synthase type II